MATTTATLTVRQGDTYRASFWRQNATGVPQPLSGYYALFQVLSRAGGSVLLSVSSQNLVEANGTVQVEPSAQTGLITVRLTAQQTALLTRNCVFTLDIISLTDATEINNIASGTVILNKVGA